MMYNCTQCSESNHKLEVWWDARHGVQRAAVVNALSKRNARLTARAAEERRVESKISAACFAIVRGKPHERKVIVKLREVMDVLQT